MQSIESPAFVVNIAQYGESHRVVSLATRERGLVHAMARHARKSLKRFPGAIDYFKLIDISASKKSTRDELWQLERARITHYYQDIIRNMSRYLAGCWVIQSCRLLVPQEVGDPLAFDWMKESLDYFESSDPSAPSVFSSFVRLMNITGNLPSFDRCVSCGKEAPPGRDATFDPSAGGIVCRKCGGGKDLLPGDLRQFLALASRAGSLSALKDFPPELLLAAERNGRLLFRIIEEMEGTISGRKNFAASVLFKALMP
jgi:DNA repair protein RecO (recombination protein O)